MRIKVEHPIMAALIGEIDPSGSGAADALVRVISLHEPVAEKVSDGFVAQWSCKGCDPGEYAEEDPAAPCRTLRTIAEVLDVEVPE